MTKLSEWKIAGAVLLLCAATAVAAPAQTFTTLLNFDGYDGAIPESVSLVQGADGAFYGTTDEGGNIQACTRSGCGTAFRITSEGTLTSLHLIPADGYLPFGGLMLASNGSFYGTGQGGGVNSAGTVFKITPGGALTVLHSFAITDGMEPTAPPIQATDGNFYGTTSGGGTGGSCPFDGCGTVFKITPAGALTTLYNFCGQANCTDGSLPIAGLLQATDRNLYGTTVAGGTASCTGGCGTIFKIGLGGGLTTLHSFDNGDGSSPYAGLIQGADGDLYGTTVGGGATGGGTAFKITTAGQLTTLYNFCTQPGCADGQSPRAPLIQANDGNFYGTTSSTIFELTAGGVLTTLLSFAGSDAQISGGLLQATSGIFYGTTPLGGNLACDHHNGCGTVFSLNTGLGPFVSFVNGFGRIGQTGGILGQGFTGTTGVSLNGIPASFTVESDTFIKATVPVGATTGYVTVTTPSGVLTSNVPFHVLP
jgi:uncharacterized repeat protein (TIGR03803 family)